MYRDGNNHTVQVVIITLTQIINLTLKFPLNAKFQFKRPAGCLVIDN